MELESSDSMPKFAQVTVAARRDPMTGVMSLEVYARPGDPRDRSTLEVEPVKPAGDYTASDVFQCELTFGGPVRAEGESGAPWAARSSFTATPPAGFVVVTYSGKIVALAPVRELTPSAHQPVAGR